VELVSHIDLYQFTGIFSVRMVGRDSSTQQTNKSNYIRVSVCSLTFDRKYPKKYSIANANNLCFTAVSCFLIGT
jgi:hypothetical protein